MQKMLLRNVTIAGETFDKLYFIEDDDGLVVFLPLLWTIHLSKTDSIYGWHTTSKRGDYQSRKSSINTSVIENFDARISSENTIDNYVGHVFKFLRYINDLHHSESAPSVHQTYDINTRFLNHYLNEVLPDRLDSLKSVLNHQAAISAYFNFLFAFKIKDRLISCIPRKTGQIMAERDVSEQKINYISKDDRFALLRACNSQRDRLILRMGYEVGLRAKENTGLLLETHKAKLKTHKGLLELFSELDIYPNKQSFEYLLNGKCTKGKKSRYTSNG